MDKIEQIRRAHASAKPKPSNPAWCNTHRDLGVILFKLGRRTKALEGLLKHYVQLVECGDCGNWDAETEDEVIAAREALSDE